MRMEEITDKQMEAAFKRWEDDPTGGIPSDTGFSTQTQAAMAAFYRDPGSESMRAARVAFRGQLNGNHDKQDEAEWNAVLSEFNV